MAKKFIPCDLKQLPDSKLVEAAATSKAINPANSPESVVDRAMSFGLFDWPPTPQELAVITSKYWGTGGVKLSVAFLDTRDAGIQNMILRWMNYWQTKGGANVQFALSNDSNSAQVRIARQRGGGYWSYLGTDVLSIPRGQATMNLDSFTLRTSESEQRRVIVHETGHTMGFPHEHLRPGIIAKLNRAKTIEYFRQRYGWDERTTVSNVLTPVTGIQGSQLEDVSSIMAYSLPGSITTDGRDIPGGSDLTPTDITTVQSLYRNPNPPPPPPPPTGDRRFLLLELQGQVTSARIVSLE